MKPETEFTGAIAAVEQLAAYRHALINREVIARLQMDFCQRVSAENTALKAAIATLQTDSSTLQRQNTWLKVACLVMGLGCFLSFLKTL